MKFIKALLFSQILFLFSFTLNAQVVADFTVNDSLGCGSLGVTFTDNSTNAVNYNWDLGNGETSMSSISFSYIYSSPGIYPVVLTVDDGGVNFDSHTIIIKVFNNPEAGIIPDITSGCAPLNVTFQQDVDEGDAPISAYTWSFGDGNGGVTEYDTISNKYENGDVYSVTLAVIDTNNCSSDITLENYITVFDNPTVGFDLNQYSTCEPTSQFVITSNSSQGTNPLTYSWDFGDGTFSDMEIPDAHEYSNIGSYNILLSVTDDNGCVSSDSTPVSIANIEAAFEFEGGDIACPNDSVIFTNLSPANTYIWDYGDGETGYDAFHEYDNPGPYEVTLIASSGADCADTITHTLTVEEVVAHYDFLSDHYSCEAPLDVTYDASGSTASAGNIDSYYWNFGNGLTATVVSPVNTFASEGEYTDLLIVTSSNGCTDTYFLIDSVVIDFPTANFTVDTLKGCGRFIDFTDMSSSDEPITGWSWTFEGGVPSTSTEQNPTIDFTYNDQIHANEGICNVELTITNSAGCEATFDMDVFVGIEPTPHHFIFSDPGLDTYYGDYYESCLPQFYTGNPDDEDPCLFGVNTFIACASPDGIQFNDSTNVEWNGDSQFLAEMSQDAYSYDWDFGEEGGTASEPHPEYFYDDTVGYMNIQLIVGYHECYDTLVTDSMVFIKGPIIKPSIDTTFLCSDPFTYTFSAELVSVTGGYVDFGDGITVQFPSFSDDTTLVSPDPYTITHTFNNTGDFLVEFYAFNDSTNSLSGYASPDYAENGYLYPAYDDTLNHKHNCEFVESIEVIVRDIEAFATANDTTICLGTQVFLSASSSQDGSSYHWIFDGDIEEEVVDVNGIASPTLTYLANGIYHSLVDVTADNGCTDTASVTVSVFKPEVDFSMDNLDRCIPFNVIFTDDSPNSEGLIDTWDWNFGDATTDTIQNPDHDYTNGTNFPVTLTVTDVYGCTNVTSQTISSLQPTALFTPNDDAICIGDIVIFTDNSSSTLGDNLIYSWSINNVEVSQQAGDFSYNFDEAGDYSVLLNVKESNDLTCFNEYIFDPINVQEAKAEFIADQTFWDCRPSGLITFNLEYPDIYNDIDTCIWSFGYDNATSTEKDTAQYLYILPGFFTVSLQMETTNGCIATVVKDNYIEVGGAYAKFASSADTVCTGQEIHIVATESINVDNVIWQALGAQIIYQSNDSTVVSYDSEGANSVISYATDPANCVAHTDTIDIFVLKIDANFSVDDDDGCDQLDVVFNNNSIGITDNWNWDFGDGTTDTIQNPPLHNYNAPGTYPITLALSNNYCNMEFVDRVIVHESPKIVMMPDMHLCPGKTVDLYASPADLITQWYIGDQPLSGQATFTHLPTEDTTYYSYTVEDPITHCTDVDTVIVTVADDFDYSITITPENDPEVFEPPYNTEIFIGSYVDITVDPEINAMVSWSSIGEIGCDNCLYNQVRPMDSTMYTITVSDSMQCFVKSDIVNIAVIERYEVEVPNTFTPNGDGKNDVINVLAIGADELLEFKIFNRWGQMVFSTTDFNKGWDGTYKGKPQNIDTYVWMATVKFLDGREVPKQGDITLVR